MWGVLVLLFGMMFHSRSGSKRKSKSRAHRQFYRNGRMTDELNALHETLEFEAYREKRGRK